MRKSIHDFAQYDMGNTLFKNLFNTLSAGNGLIRFFNVSGLRPFPSPRVTDNLMIIITCNNLNLIH